MIPDHDQLSSRDLLSNVVESISTRVFWKDVNGYYLGCNTMFAKDAGFSTPAEIIGKTDHDLCWKKCAEQYQRLDKEIIASGTPHLNFEESIESGDGKLIWLRKSKSPLYDKNRNIIGIFGIYEKTTEQKITRQELTLAKFVMDNAPLNITFIDENGHICYVNKTTTETLGYQQHELLTMTIPDINPLSSMEKWQNHWAELKHNKTATFETQHQRKDGTMFQVEVFANYVDFNGEAYNVSFDRDITQYKKNQLLLEASKKKFETLFNAYTDGIVIANFEGTILDLNTTTYQRLGYTKEELLSHSISELTSKEEAAKALERVALLKQQGSMTFEGITYKKDGTPMPVEITSVIIELEGQEVILNISRDITERKHLEEQLVQSQKMESIGTLVGGIAHDFNNILAAIQGNLYLATQQCQNDPATLTKLTNIESLSSRAADMVQQLLTFARKDTVMMDIFCVNDFLKGSANLIGTSIPENIEHYVKVCDEPLFIEGNATQIQQLLINLINNARDAVADKEKPKVSCILSPYTATKAFKKRHPEQSHEHFARISVKDNGCGIPPETLEKIFEPFFTTKDTGQGTGLGLSMLYGAMQNHGGSIEVNSEPNIGTRFRLYFPLSHHTVKTEPTKSNVPAKTQGETILLVDDEVDVRETAAEVLRNMGYHVIEAGDGERALYLFNTYQGKIDLILTDVVMPRMGGHSLFMKIRQQNKQTPIILVTGYDRSHILSSNSKLEHFKVINKPFDFDKLSQDIQELIKTSS